MKTDIISIVDDDKIYQFTMTKTIEATRKVKQILVFSDGEEAFNFLTKKEISLCVVPKDAVFYSDTSSFILVSQHFRSILHSIFMNL